MIRGALPHSCLQGRLQSVLCSSTVSDLEVTPCTRTSRLPPMIELSLAAFRRDLPELMNTHYREWVAYHGEERVGFGKTEFELYQVCFRMGLTEEEFLVRSVESEMAEEADPNEWWD